ncbi:hypothetical protein PN499_19330 [Kamptonema animale CS-326]|uniref:hypothetical protein n=1 Tax=Kamptonema animale TaxID=92934 RepID=UPI00232F130D|nr:hypothetical protein [Kamptonema animale]MDB9513350.1 hypothetical protein [Kamptonema animale CS-326]
MEAILERAWELKQNLIDFVLDAEGELAVALEAYIAAGSARDRYDIAQQNQLVDTFLVEGRVAEQTPLDLFIAQTELEESDRQLLDNWRRSFIGLFEISQILPDGFELINWLTAKHYTVKVSSSETLKDTAKLKVGEILLVRIAPVSDSYWMFSGPHILMGKLGKPKLAVAIGNFKQNHKNALYSDAPELLEQAWQSVEQYHQEFTDFFGSDEVNLSGYHLNKKIAEFQEVITKKRLAEAGIDNSKSLEEIATESGVDATELRAAATEMGADADTVDRMLGKPDSKMVMPKIDLPDTLKKAEQVTAISHPRWGQMFLPTYTQVTALLETEDWQSLPNANKLVRYYLEDATINAFIWQRLAQTYPTQLEKVLQTVLERPDFNLERDLEQLLQTYNKPLKPELPEIASVPLHLHNLFQEAMAEVNKSKSKSGDKKKGAKGFKSS